LRAKDIIKSKCIHRRTKGSDLADEYDRQSHSMSAHFQDCYSVMAEDGWKLFTSFDTIRERYEQYCSAINAAPESDRSLSFFIKNTLGCHADREYVGQGDERKRVRGYFGLSFEEENFKSIIASILPTSGTDIFSLGQIGTDNRTDKEITGDTRTDKITNYPFDLVQIIKSNINNMVKKSVPSVQASHANDSSVPKKASSVQPTVPKEDKLVVLYVLKDIDKFVGVDGRTYGPFGPDEVASIPDVHVTNLVLKGFGRAIG
jgi:hypothetical protein